MAKEKVNYQEVYDLYQLCSETIVRFINDNQVPIGSKYFVVFVEVAAENGAYPPTQNGLIHPQLLLKWP